MTLYQFVGPKRIADRVRPEPAGVPIRSPGDVVAWMRSTDQELSGECVIATFVVDQAGVLLLADRRSEHVACAGRQPVRSAGEITIVVGRTVEVVAVTSAGQDIRLTGPTFEIFVAPGLRDSPRGIIPWRWGLMRAGQFGPRQLNSHDVQFVSGMKCYKMTQNDTKNERCFPARH